MSPSDRVEPIEITERSVKPKFAPALLGGANGLVAYLNNVGSKIHMNSPQLCGVPRKVPAGVVPQHGYRAGSPCKFLPAVTPQPFGGSSQLTKSIVIIV